MLTALIVEDELKICQLIQKLVDWERLGISVIGVCNDGLSALEKVKQDRPDIVVTDIRMPAMSGLDLIKLARENNISSEFIIISGYKQFDYAHVAMKYGVSEYLLKPISREELEGALLRSLTKCRNADITQPTGNRSMWSIRRDLRNSLWERFLDTDSNIDFNLELLNERYHLMFRNGVFYRVISIVFYGAETPEMWKMTEELIEDIRAVLDPKCIEALPYHKNARQILVIINYSSDIEAESMIDEVAGVIEEKIITFGEANVRYIMGLSEPDLLIQKIRGLIVSAKCAVFSGMMQEKIRVCYWDKQEFGPITKENILTAEQKAELYTLADVMNVPQFTAQLKSAMYKVTEKTSPEVPLFLCHFAATAITGAAKKAGYSYENEKQIFAMIEEAMLKPSYEEYVAFVVAWVQRQFDSCIAQRKELGSRPVHHSKLYIQQHFMEQITLEDVAEVVHLNASYFSIIFKKEIGQTFSDYLTTFRIEEAKRLLRESDYTVAEIGEMVGYIDTKYFSRKFTKIVGVNPSTYRIMWG